MENVNTRDVPREIAIGAIAVNPNSQDRVARVLDEIINAAEMNNIFGAKLVFDGETVIKEVSDDGDSRKFIVVTADGLPYKAMIELIRNVHTCAVCGKRLRFIAEVTDHISQTHHREYFQTYGNILPNIGHFHYGLTMLRSYVKLKWSIDYEELVKSIHFETPQALFMQEKVTDFRKSLDTFRTARKATLRELVTPFVKYALENEIEVSVNSFLMWKKFFVNNNLYNAIFRIEETYGTAFLLFLSALRANNFKLVKIAKKAFSSLFHVNNHPNYSIMDIHTEYLERKLDDNNPELRDYLDARRCTNLSNKPFAYEPLDERNEEYNKRGLNMQKIQTVDDFKRSFKLVDSFTELKQSIFDDYEMKMHGGNTSSVVDYEENILKMRVAMRKQSFLNRPEKEMNMISLQNQKLNPKLIDIVNITQSERQTNILNIIRHNSFVCGFNRDSGFKVLAQDAKDKLATNYEIQLEILIASEVDPEIRENLREYCRLSSANDNFDEEKIVDDILNRNFSFL